MDKFEQSDFVLNYRPRIEYVEPDQVEVEPPPPSPEVTLDTQRDKTQEIINGLKVASQLIDAIQERVDKRVADTGGVEIKLDPVKDYHVVAAMKRRFPEKADPTVISFDDYKKALDCLNQSALKAPEVSVQDVMAARNDPYRTDFGGYDNKQGENRPEISSPMQSVEPLDLDKFQQAAVLGLFALMLPLIKAESIKDIALHTASIPHGI